MVRRSIVRSNDPKFKKIPGYSQELDYIPSQKLTFDVDSAAVMAAGVLDTAYLPYMQKQMTRSSPAIIRQAGADHPRYVAHEQLETTDLLRDHR